MLKEVKNLIETIDNINSEEMDPTMCRRYQTIRDQIQQELNSLTLNDLEDIDSDDIDRAPEIHQAIQATLYDGTFPDLNL